MKIKKFIPIFLLTVLILTSIYFVQNKNIISKQSQTYYYLGTVNEVTIFNEKKSSSEKLLNGCDSILKDIDNKMSTHIPGSDIYKINENAGTKFTKISKDTFSVIKNSINYSNLSNKIFDITIGPLVDLWGIGSDHAKVPSDLEIRSKLNLINFENIIFDENNTSIKLNNKNMKIDLGGIAKGFATDKIVSYLRENNVHSAIINLGGNVYVLGNKDKNNKFSIGIQNPTKPDGSSIGNLKLSDKSIVTSGVYERFIEKNGKIYHHMLNPFTGYPFENELSSVTIISNKSINCDALSTSAFGLGLADGLKLIDNINNVDAIFITKDKKIHLTSGIKNIFNLTDKDFTIIN